MKHGLLITSLGIALTTFGVSRQGWLFPIAWLGLNFVMVGVAHLGRFHSVFGKRRDGTLPLWSWLLFLPLHLYTLTVWHIVRLFSREPVQDQLTPEIVLGRRMLGSELDEEFNNFVDLTAEFQEPRQIRKIPGYQCFPILDASAPNPRDLLAAVNSISPGRTFIHCAQGHGRTGLFALAVLLKNKHVRDCAEGLSILQRIRPGIALSRSQLQCVEDLARELHRSRN